MEVYILGDIDCLLVATLRQHCENASEGIAVFGNVVRFTRDYESNRDTFYRLIDYVDRQLQEFATKLVPCSFSGNFNMDVTFDSSIYIALESYIDYGRSGLTVTVRLGSSRNNMHTFFIFTVPYTHSEEFGVIYKNLLRTVYELNRFLKEVCLIGNVLF